MRVLEGFFRRKGKKIEKIHHLRKKQIRNNNPPENGDENLSNLKGVVLEKVRSQDPFVLKSREHLLIQKWPEPETILFSSICY